MTSLTQRIESWLLKAEVDHKYMSVNNSSWHMSVFPVYHTSLEDVRVQMEKEKEPMSYSTTSAVYDLKDGSLIYAWHSGTSLPEPSEEDVSVYRKEQEVLESKARAQKEATERNTLAEERLTSWNEGREQAYKNYVRTCALIHVQPVPFFQYEYKQETDVRNTKQERAQEAGKADGAQGQGDS